MSDSIDFRDLVMSSRRRTEAMAERARANAAFELEQCARLVGGINPANSDAGIPLNEAQRLAQHTTDLVRYLSALEAYEVASVLLEES